MVKPRKVAALAALVNKHNYAGEGSDAAKECIREMLKERDNPAIHYVATGGLAVLFSSEGPPELYLKLGDLK